MPIKLSHDEWQSYNNATHCYICNKEFPYGNVKFTEAKLTTNTESILDDSEHLIINNDDLTTEDSLQMLDELLAELHDPKNIAKVKREEKKQRKELNELRQFYKVRDHDHVTGRFRGAAHMASNLRLKIQPNKTPIPVVFHNLQGYDGHLVIQGLHGYKEIDPDATIGCIPHNMEKYMAFTVGRFKFIDSYNFLKYSLDKLAGVLSDDELVITRQDTVPEDIPLRRKKGMYPYEYMDSYDVFRETELPSKDLFFSRLTNTHITDQDYEHARNIWTHSSVPIWETITTCIYKQMYVYLQMYSSPSELTA